MIDTLLALAQFPCLSPLAFHFTPGCCCAVECLLFDDNFTRANSSTVGNGWTEQNGDWSITTNNLEVSSASAIITRDAGTDDFTLAVTFNSIGSTAAGAPRIIFNWIDNSNYDFIEARTSGTVFDCLVNQRIAGVETAIAASKLSTGEFVNNIIFRMCFKDDIVWLRLGINGDVGSDGQARTLTFNRTLASTIVGVGTSGSYSGTLSVDRFVITDHSGSSGFGFDIDDCFECERPWDMCDNDVLPNTLQLTFTSAPAAVSELNAGTWICQQDEDGVARWNYGFLTAINQIRVEVISSTYYAGITYVDTGGGESDGDFYVVYGKGGTFYRWKLTNGGVARTDCDSWSGLTLTGFGATAGSTCSVTGVLA